MTKSNVLITGATGFIGRAFLSRLDKDRYNISVLARSKPSNFPMESIQDFYEQDLTLPFQLNASFDYVFHLAACNFTHVAQASAKEYQAVNVQGTKNLIEAIKVKKFIFMSTTKVYKAQGLPLTEKSPLGPAGLYEQSKLEAEDVCRRQIPQEDLIVLRIGNIVGPGQADKALVPVFFKNALRDKPLHMTVSAKTRLQLLFVDDVIDIFLKILQKPVAGGVYNAAPLEMITMEELARQIIALTHSQSAIECTNSDSVECSPVAADQLTRALQWQPKTTVKELLQQSYQYYKSLYAA